MSDGRVGANDEVATEERGGGDGAGASEVEVLAVVDARSTLFVPVGTIGYVLVRCEGVSSS